MALCILTILIFNISYSPASRVQDGPGDFELLTTIDIDLQTLQQSAMAKYPNVLPPSYTENATGASVDYPDTGIQANVTGMDRFPLNIKRYHRARG